MKKWKTDIVNGMDLWTYEKELKKWRRLRDKVMAERSKYNNANFIVKLFLKEPMTTQDLMDKKPLRY